VAGTGQVGADELLVAQRGIEHDQQDQDQGPGATEVSPTMKPPTTPMMIVGSGRTLTVRRPRPAP